jgi:hypothetical protein
MWENMITYLAWRGGASGYKQPPAFEPNRYAAIKYPNIEMKICTKYPDEIAWHQKHGAEVVYP